MDISISRPIIIEDNYAPLKRVNKDINRYYKDIQTEWDGLIRDPGSYWPDMRYEGRIESEITYNQNGLLSLLVKEYGYYGGAHGGRYHKGLVYDLNSGKRLTIADLTQMDDANIIQIVKKAVIEDRETKRYDYWANFIPAFDNSDEINFYLSEQGIHLILNEYEAGCYAAGLHYVLIRHLKVR